MKRLTILLVALYGFSSSQAQEFGASVNYLFLNANEWNSATQIYNFSRPFLGNKQPLLKHGICFGFYYLKKPENKITWGPSINVSFHRSSSENPNFDISINSWLLDLGAKIQYRPMKVKNEKFHVCITPRVTTVMLSRKLNGDIIIVGEPEDGVGLRKFGIGLGLNAQFGYDFYIDNKVILSPIIGISYSPYIWVSRGEVIFNEAAAGDLKSTTTILGFRWGIVLKSRKM